MGRATRNQTAGYHYVLNRGVELRTIFITSDDYVYFIFILCELSDIYSFNVHSFSLISNSYHILLETSKDNLSNIMKLIGSKYSNYFNKKYKRSGYLWEGRYRSYFISDINYVFYYIQHIEQLPLFVGSTLKLDLYYHSTYRQFVGLDQCLSCIKKSIIFQRFNTKQEIKDFFTVLVRKEAIDNISRIIYQKTISKSIKTKNIKLLLYGSLDKNQNILNTYKNGFSQIQIAKELGISQQAIQKKLKRLNKINLKEPLTNSTITK